MKRFAARLGTSAVLLLALVPICVVAAVALGMILLRTVVEVWRS